MNREEFIKEIQLLGINSSQEQLEKLDLYYKCLSDYNSHTNLTAIIEEKEVYLKHFYDSLTIVKEIDLNKHLDIIDIGSGAGFPGIVLKIFFPSINITILDSNGKKTKFIEWLVKELNLKNVTIINDRAETYAKIQLNSFDACVSRAVAYLDIITELSLPFIKPNGKVILMKGKLESELKILQNHFKELNIERYEINTFKLPYIDDERNLISIYKKEPTKKIMNYSQIVKRNKKWNCMK